MTGSHFSLPILDFLKFSSLEPDIFLVLPFFAFFPRPKSGMMMMPSDLFTCGLLTTRFRVLVCQAFWELRNYEFEGRYERTVSKPSPTLGRISFMAGQSQEVFGR
jgi:hypothetical protein